MGLCYGKILPYPESDVPVLTERLEIRLSRDTFERLRQEAARRGISVGQLTREAIDLLLKQDQQARIEAARTLCRINAPVGDWPVMKEQIEQARRKADPT